MIAALGDHEERAPRAEALFGHFPSETHRRESRDTWLTELLARAS
jgi:hypothetical protein